MNSLLTIRSSISVLALLVASAAAAACSSPPAGIENEPVGSGKADKGDKNKDGTDKDKADKNKTDTSDKPTTNPTEPPKPEDEDEGPALFPREIFTGFVGGADVFKVPIATTIKGEVKWEVADPTMATIAATTWKPDELKDAPLFFAIITTLKAGSTTISVSQGEIKLNTKITIAAYTADQFATGKTRYKTGGTEANRKPCASCHEAANGWDHSSTWTGALPDEEILTAITTGQYGTDTGPEVWKLNKGDHKWALTDPEKTGIIAFLRGLNPKGLPAGQ